MPSFPKKGACAPMHMRKEEMDESKMPPAMKAKMEKEESPAKKKAEAKFGYADGGEVKGKKC